MSGPTEKPLARAASHLAAAQYAEAAGAYRAVLCIDPQEHLAYLGLADCAVGRGRVEEAIEELVATAKDFAERGSLPPAFAFLTKALAIDPTRLELHIDVAELEAAAGREDMATSRLQNLALAYEGAGRLEEAEAVLEAAAAFGWGAAEEDEVPEPGTTTLVTPTVLKSVEPTSDAVPVAIAESHTVPQLLVARLESQRMVASAEPAVETVPPVRTGDTFVGPAPGARPQVEPSVVARGAPRRGQVGPALRWRASTVQMQALTAEIPGVPKKVAPIRTAPIVHAPKRSTSRRPEPVVAKPEPVVAKPEPVVAKREPVVAKREHVVAKPEPVVAKPEPIVATPARKALAIKPLPGRAKPRPAPAPKTIAAPSKPSAVPSRPAPKTIAAPSRPAPKTIAAPSKPSAAPCRLAPKTIAAPSKPAPRKEGESLADRLRRQSKRDLPPKPRPAAPVRTEAKSETFDEDATSLWCPEPLLLQNDRAPQ